jgi:cytoskeleton protein RodZ
LTETPGPRVGDTLRRARQARGLTIAEVAQQLKFAPRQLEALEDDRLDALPGATITRGMVRNYARLLKLEPEPLLALLAERLQAPDTGRLAARYTEPVPFSDHGRRSNIVYLSLSLLVLAVVGVVVYQWYGEPDAPPDASKVAPAPGAARAPKPVSAPPAAREPAPASPPAPVAGPAAATDRAAVSEPSAAPVAPLAEEKPERQAAAASSHRLVFRFQREAWIEVRDGAERLLLAQLAPEGAERVVQGRAPIKLVIGNAQHVQLTLDGKPVDLKRHTKNDVARFELP